MLMGMAKINTLENRDCGVGLSYTCSDMSLNPNSGLSLSNVSPRSGLNGFDVLEK